MLCARGHVGKQVARVKLLHGGHPLVSISVVACVVILAAFSGAKDAGVTWGSAAGPSFHATSNLAVSQVVRVFRHVTCFFCSCIRAQDSRPLVVFLL